MTFTAVGYGLPAQIARATGFVLLGQASVQLTDRILREPELPHGFL
jgi:hypothetical protein